jgi:DNA-binding transcriptional MerR regulator
MDRDATLAGRRAAAESYPFISVKKIAAKYNVSIRTLRRMHRAGKLPPRKKRGRQYEYPVDAIEQLFSIQKSWGP